MVYADCGELGMDNHRATIFQFHKELSTIIHDLIPTEFEIENSSPVDMGIAVGLLGGSLRELEQQMYSYLMGTTE